MVPGPTDNACVAVRILVNTERHRHKAKNAAVAVSMTAPDDPYRYLSVAGEVEGITTEGAHEHIETLPAIETCFWLWAGGADPLFECPQFPIVLSFRISINVSRVCYGTVRPGRPETPVSKRLQSVGFASATVENV